MSEDKILDFLNQQTPCVYCGADWHKGGECPNRPDDEEIILDVIEERAVLQELSRFGDNTAHSDIRKTSAVS